MNNKQPLKMTQRDTGSAINNLRTQINVLIDHFEKETIESTSSNSHIKEKGHLNQKNESDQETIQSLRAQNVKLKQRQARNTEKALALRKHFNQLRAENKALKDLIPSDNGQLSVKLAELLIAYQAKHLPMSLSMYKIQRLADQLNELTNYEISEFIRFSRVLNNRNQPVNSVLRLFEDNPVEAINHFIKLINKDESFDVVDIEDLHEKTKEIIHVIWDKRLNERVEIRQTINNLMSQIGLKLQEPLVGGTFNSREQVVIGRVPKLSGMGYTQIIEVYSPTILKIKTDQVLKKAKVIVAD